MEYAKARYSIETVKDHHIKPMNPEITCNLSHEQRASHGVYFRVIDTCG